jgi:hypothetical protein
VLPEIYVAVLAVLLIGSLAWQHGYKRGKEDGVDSFLRAYGEQIRSSQPDKN